MTTRKPLPQTLLEAPLNEALMVFESARLIKARPLERRLDEIAFYPAHDERKKSAGYKAVHKRLVVTLDLPCAVCGVKHSTLKKPRENRYGAKAMETHHHVIEWSLMNAIDPRKFNKIILPRLRVQHPADALYAKKALTAKEIAAWVDHSEDNLLVLCDVHHRAQYFGIHEITYPVWAAQELLKGDFDKIVRRQVAARGVPTMGEAAE